MTKIDLEEKQYEQAKKLECTAGNPERRDGLHSMANGSSVYADLLLIKFAMKRKMSLASNNGT